MASSAFVEAAVRRTSSAATPGRAAGSLEPVAAQPDRIAAAASDSEISGFMPGCLAVRFGGVTHVAVGGDFAIGRAFDRIMLRMERREAEHGKAGERGDERAHEDTDLRFLDQQRIAGKGEPADEQAHREADPAEQRDAMD